MNRTLVAPGILALLLAAACTGGPASPELTKPNTASNPGRSAQLEQRIARLELQLLEKHSQVEDLQTRLDDARREVVRGMARTQSLATRAEAASGMAEAEIALRGLRAGGTAEVREVTELMRLSTAEFERENYGGALYLANQAKIVADLALQLIGERVLWSDD